MPLSVSSRRKAVRQFVAERHGRPEDKRLDVDGPKFRWPEKAPEAILDSARGEEVAGRRQQALARVRQRRAERALENAKELEQTTLLSEAQTTCSSSRWEHFRSESSSREAFNDRVQAEVHFPEVSDVSKFSQAVQLRLSLAELGSGPELSNEMPSAPSAPELRELRGSTLKCPAPKVPKAFPDNSQARLSLKRSKYKEAWQRGGSDCPEFSSNFTQPNPWCLVVVQ